MLIVLLLASNLLAQKVEHPISFLADSLSAGFKISKGAILGGILLPQGACSKIYIDVTNEAEYALDTWYQLQKDGADYYEQGDSSTAFALSFQPIEMKDWAYMRFRMDASIADTVNATYIERSLK